jgi:hypothetical protein
MGSLFQGTPQVATSYTTSSTETPKWMQDAIYNQTQWAQNVANAPYEGYNLPTVAGLSPLQQQAYSGVQAAQGQWKPSMDTTIAGMGGYSTAGTSGGLSAAQNPYLQQGLSGSNLAAGQGLFEQAAGMDVAAAANPYLQAAGRSSVENISNYMNPYQQGVLDLIAKQGTRNLTENLLPGVSDAFVRAGQFGSNRMGEFGSRALRDTQDSILNEQAKAAQAGYTQALGASQTDLAREGQLATTAGQLTSQQAQNLANVGQQYTTAGQTQQQYGLNAEQAVQAAQQADYQRQMQALQQQAQMTQQGQTMGYADTGALESAGLAQQAQQQAQLNAAKTQFDTAQAYPKTQLDWLNAQVRGMAAAAPTTTTANQTTSGASYSPSPLAQLASGLAAYGGLSKIV